MRRSAHHRGVQEDRRTEDLDSYRHWASAADHRTRARPATSHRRLARSHRNRDDCRRTSSRFPADRCCPAFQVDRRTADSAEEQEHRRAARLHTQIRVSDLDATRRRRIPGDCPADYPAEADRRIPSVHDRATPAKSRPALHRRPACREDLRRIRARPDFPADRNQDRRVLRHNQADRHRSPVGSAEIHSDRRQSPVGSAETHSAGSAEIRSPGSAEIHLVRRHQIPAGSAEIRPVHRRDREPSCRLFSAAVAHRQRRAVASRAARR